MNTGSGPGDHKPTSHPDTGSEGLIDMSKATQGAVSLHQKLGLLTHYFSAPGEVSVVH